MKSLHKATAELEELRSALEHQGHTELADRARGVLATLRAAQTLPEPDGGVMTTGEAAKALGIHSVNTIKRWVGEGQLLGFRRGNRVMVSRHSVEQMANRTVVDEQRDREKQLLQDLREFGSDEPLDEELLGSPWTGRRPWGEDPAPAPAASASLA